MHKAEMRDLTTTHGRDIAEYRRANLISNQVLVTLRRISVDVVHIAFNINIGNVSL
jgi:hypothetical protein